MPTIFNIFKKNRTNLTSSSVKSSSMGLTAGMLGCARFNGAGRGGTGLSDAVPVISRTSSTPSVSDIFDLSDV